jgi:predicted transcriptional regulator
MPSIALNLSEIELRLLRYVEQNPGIRYRELLRLSGLTNGVLSYHIAILKRSNLIVTDIAPRETRFFPASVSENESAILKHLRNPARRQIVRILLEHDVCTFNELVEFTGKAQSTVSTHLKKLREAQIVIVRYAEYYSLYMLIQRDLVADVLSKYKASLADKLIDNYTRLIEEL